MEKRCPNCGNILNEQAKFCPLCGAKQDAQAEAAGNHCPFAARRWNPVQDSVETAEGIFWRLGKKTVMSMQLRRIM